MHMETIKVFSYNDAQVEFDISDTGIMVNATEMAKIFDKRVDVFMKSDHVKSFIEVLKRPPYGGQLGVKNDEDLVKNRKSAGLWMHRILALKFAAWLDPNFEVWVYTTIDDLLFGRYRAIDASLKESAQRRNAIEAMQQALQATPEYQQLERLQLEERQAAYGRAKLNKSQLTLFQYGTLV